MFADLIGNRIQISGPGARLTAAATQASGLRCTNFATNAAKYGALSNAAGRVPHRVADRRPGLPPAMARGRRPAVVPPTRKGFGQAVIGRMAEAAVAGTATVEYPATGVCWTLVGQSAFVLGGAMPAPEQGSGLKR